MFPLNPPSSAQGCEALVGGGEGVGSERLGGSSG